MTSDPFPSPEAIEAADLALIERGASYVQPLSLGKTALDAAVNAQPVVALPSCPMCEGTGVKDAEIEPDAACPCPSCKGSGVDRFIPESEIRALLDEARHAYRSAGVANDPESIFDDLVLWLDEREARQ